MTGRERPQHEKTLTTPVISTSGYRHYVLTLVFLGYALNLFDRQIIGILLPAIKADFALSDTMLGLLSGLAFALFYATVGVPIARFADVGPRKWIMSISIGTWSLMTLLGGFAQNAGQLILSRFGVGIGEAGFTPSAVSLLADYYPPKERILAMSTVNLGPVLGITLGLIIGGAAAEALGWRGALMLAGAPGLLFTVIFVWTMREPKRGALDVHEARLAEQVEDMNLTPFWKQKGFVFIVIAAALANLCIFGIATWMPSLLDREYGIGPAKAGLILGLTFGIGGCIGTFGGGWLAQRLAHLRPAWALWVPAIASLACFPLAVAAFTSSNLTMMLTFYALAYTLSFVHLGPTFASIQALIPPNQRAISVATLMFFTNLIGLGLGPQIVGIASDYFAAHGNQSLRYAMLFISPFFLVPFIFFGLAGKQLPGESKTVI